MSENVQFGPGYGRMLIGRRMTPCSGLTLLLILSTAGPAAAGSCATPEHRQFDFWIGDWDAFDTVQPDKVVARLRVDRILDGCVLREDYQGEDGHKGQSFSLYDASIKAWRQSWVTNRGEFLLLGGHFQDNQMVLTGADFTPDGKERQVRGVWKQVPGGIRETAVTSIDGGKTWKPWFDLIMVRSNVPAKETDMKRVLTPGIMAAPAVSAANGSVTEDQKTVAALDTQYQAAVKQNDADTMDRILADDFVLVTGSGKSYTKADLLNEARSGKIRYEIQDDTDQTVRVWGDTAVITAKLRAKGATDGKPFDKTVWFSDTYVRTPAAWRYVFGQSSLPPTK
jgi:ketosteroid isomerase-like protein